MKFADGSMYYGDLDSDDDPHGHGVHIYSDGSKHVGGYHNGKFHGHGTYMSPYGDIYIGNFLSNDFEHGRRHGDGVLT
jgi:hypothetical protein